MQLKRRGVAKELAGVCECDVSNEADGPAVVQVRFRAS